MMNLNTIYVRAAAGTLVASLIIVGAKEIFPMTGVNTGGHVLTWAMAAVVGLMITLADSREMEDWAMIPEEAEGEKHEEVIRERHTVKAADLLVHPGRMAGNPRAQPVLAYPTGKDRSKPVVLSENGFRTPGEKEKEACLAFAAENPICALATVDETDSRCPHVRTVFLWRADESGFYFVLFSSKQVSRQVKANPQVEICFQNHPQELTQARQLRVKGRMNLVSNQRLQQQASRDRSIVNTLAGTEDNAQLEIFHLPAYELRFWQMADVSMPAKGELIPA